MGIVVLVAIYCCFRAFVDFRSKRFLLGFAGLISATLLIYFTGLFYLLSGPWRGI